MFSHNRKKNMHCVALTKTQMIPTPVTEVRGDHKEVVGIGQIAGENLTVLLFLFQGQGPDENRHYGKLPATAGDVKNERIQSRSVVISERCRIKSQFLKLSTCNPYILEICINKQVGDT